MASPWECVGEDRPTVLSWNLEREEPCGRGSRVGLGVGITRKAAPKVWRGE